MSPEIINRMIYQIATFLKANATRTKRAASLIA
jgi:hypothetical protein